MRYWIHEAAGWLLLVVGLYLFYACFAWLLDPNHVIEAGVLSVIAIIVFRGGLHMLKVAMAARICMQAQDGQTPNEPLGLSNLPPGLSRRSAHSRQPAVRPRRPDLGQRL